MAFISLITVLFSLASACIFNSLYRMYNHRQRFKGLPKPPHSFIWGHLKIMGEAAAIHPPNMHPQAYLTFIAQKYNLPDIFYLDLWPVADSMVVVTTPELMNQVHVTQALPQHHVGDDFLAPITGRNVVAAANGPIWKKTHAAMSPAFSTSHIRSLTGVFADETMLFRDTLDGLAKSGEVFSMEQTGAKLIFDAIARIVFNFSLHAQTTGSSYLDDLREMIRLAEAQFSWSPIVKVKTFFRRRVILKRLDASIVLKIKERLTLLRREKIVPSRKNPLSILDLMLREQVQEDGMKEDEMPREDLELLVTNIKGLLLGGSGTTNNTLCYTYMLLSKSPEVLQKLREEHSSIFHQDFNTTVDILLESPQKLQELDYTEAVIKESLRLFPVGFGVREAPTGATVPYNGTNYPIDGLQVMGPAHPLHYNQQYYPNPTAFLPERFLDPSSSTVSNNCFRTFSRGPRACLGRNLAMNELKVILLMTIRDYDFECVGLKPNEKPRTAYTDLDTVFGDVVFQELALEAKPRGGMMMRVRKRF